METLTFTKLYYTDGTAIYRLLAHGRLRKLDPDCRNLYHLKTERGLVTGVFPKLMWCHEHKVWPKDIHAKFAFQMVDGHSEVVMLADKMRDVRLNWGKKVKYNWQDYDYIEKFAGLAKQHLQGDKEAASKLWEMLNAERYNLVYFAHGAAGGCGWRRANEITDLCIMRVFEQTILGQRAVPSPIASIKAMIRARIRFRREENRTITLDSVTIDGDRRIYKKLKQKEV